MAAKAPGRNKQQQTNRSKETKPEPGGGAVRGPQALCGGSQGGLPLDRVQHCGEDQTRNHRPLVLEELRRRHVAPGAVGSHPDYGVGGPVPRTLDARAKLDLTGISLDLVRPRRRGGSRWPGDMGHLPTRVFYAKRACSDSQATRPQHVLLVPLGSSRFLQVPLGSSRFL